MKLRILFIILFLVSAAGQAWGFCQIGDYACQQRERMIYLQQQQLNQNQYRAPRDRSYLDSQSTINAIESGRRARIEEDRNRREQEAHDAFMRRYQPSIEEQKREAEYNRLMEKYSR